MEVKEIFEEIHNKCGNLEICAYSETGCGDCLIRKTLIDAEKSLDMIEKIKEIIREEERYPVSNNMTDLRPNEHDYNKIHAEKFNRIWKVIADAENGNLARETYEIIK